MQYCYDHEGHQSDLKFTKGMFVEKINYVITEPYCVMGNSYDGAISVESHVLAWQKGPFWQDTLEYMNKYENIANTEKANFINIIHFYKYHNFTYINYAVKRYIGTIIWPRQSCETINYGTIFGSLNHFDTIQFQLQIYQVH